jgi:hypothetical protein
MIENRETLLNRLCVLFPSNNKEVEKGLATLLLNYSFASIQGNNEDGQLRYYFSTIFALLFLCNC